MLKYRLPAGSGITRIYNAIVTKHDARPFGNVLIKLKIIKKKNCFK